MTKREIIDNIAETADLTKHKTEEVVNLFIAEITNSLKRKDPVVIRNLGIFQVKHQKERQGINPSTKERITIAAKNAPKFSFASSIKNAVNED